MDAIPIRRRLRRIDAIGHARYLTFSCYRRLPLFRNDSIKQVFVDRLGTTCHEHGFALLAWVVMPEHVHLLVFPTTPQVKLARFIHALKRPHAEAVLRRWRQLDAPVLTAVQHQDGHRFWQTGGGYDRNVFSDTELFEKINYIHANPVRRGLATTDVDYEWSSARWYNGAPYVKLACDPLPL